MSRKREKVKLKNSAFFSFFQVHKKLAILLVIVVGFIGFSFAINYGRYVKDVIQMFYLRSQNFYFSSDKLTIHGKTYEINPWVGTETLDISISMSSLLNSIKGTSENIVYNVSCEGDAKVDCYFTTPGTTSERRTIPHDTHADNYVVSVTPKATDANGNAITFSDGEVVTVKVTAESESPYEETLTATFELVIGNYGVNYEIEDSINNIYFNTYVSNTLPDETVNVILEIDPLYEEEIFFDMSNHIMQQDSFQIVETTEIDGNEYVTKISFDLNPKSSLMVKYFKQDSTKDYSYVQGDSNDAVVKFSYS